MMKISVIMPVYNGEKYLKDAIYSVLNQTLTDFEFIIINDCSTDNSFDIINSFSDDRIVVLNNEQNVGVSCSLNKGLDYAAGKYIIRMDCDDICMFERFEVQYNFMEQHDEVDICGTYFEMFGKYRKVIRFPQSNEKIKAELLIHNCIAHPTVCMRRSFIEQNNIRYNILYISAQDYELWLRIFKFTQFANIPQILLKYRIHADQQGSVHKAEQPKTLRLLRKLALSYVFEDVDVKDVEFESHL